MLACLASGELLGAFGLTEDSAGSDAQAIETTATPEGPEGAGAADTVWRLDGVKRWLSFGQVAHCFLVFAKHGDRSVGILVRRDAPGVTVVPSRPTSGFRSAMPADPHLDGCRVPADRTAGAARPAR
ncbi:MULTISPECIES: acyl-CoA dehydrogenase family protein [Streptomyces albovinaceus subgroup]|uniref:acyl-CoA dehydrogenase family protein n=1 Tax=Streptomyces albovinaceus subgroup TaxID=1482558 RepID=UPI000A38F995